MPRGRPRLNTLQLTPEQTKKLEMIVASRSEEQRRVQRAKIFLAAARGDTGSMKKFVSEGIVDA